jgi:hypothetical protein
MKYELLNIKPIGCRACNIFIEPLQIIHIYSLSAIHCLVFRRGDILYVFY